MKIAIIGAGGVRTPLLVEALARRNRRLRVEHLALMDIDRDRLESIGALAIDAGEQADPALRISLTTEADAALEGADFVITTFRVGGMAARVIDERVPLLYGLVGQETTGAGGFAMAMRTIPVMLGYLDRMRTCCPSVWLVNFANPSGLITQAATAQGGWQRTVGICDAPVGLRQELASLLDVGPERLFLDYFGLNHLGWVRAVLYDGVDRLGDLLAELRLRGGSQEFGFSPDFMATLGMIPNDYLRYYYNEREEVARLQGSDSGRAERIAGWNEELFVNLKRLRDAGDVPAMRRVLQAYLDRRSATYHDPQPLEPETCPGDHKPALPPEGEGYAGVALDLIEGLSGAGERTMILNVPSAGTIAGMTATDVVEVPAIVGHNTVRPLAVGEVPHDALRLMQQVKAYELLTIEAATTGSYATALKALVTHPLVRDADVARAVLDDFCREHADSFPTLRHE